MTLHSHPQLTDDRWYRSLFELLSTSSIPDPRRFRNVLRRSKRDGLDTSLREAAALRFAADELLTRLIADYVESGWTQADVAESLGISQQAVSKRHGRRASGADPE